MINQIKKVWFKKKQWLQWNINNMVMIAIKHLQIEQISALNNL